MPSVRCEAPAGSISGPHLSGHFNIALLYKPLKGKLALPHQCPTICRYCQLLQVIHQAEVVALDLQQSCSPRQYVAELEIGRQKHDS